MRLPLRQAADCGALSHEEAIRLASVANLKQAGTRLGNWLTEKEAGRLLRVPDSGTRIDSRDRAILTLLLACGLRRDQLVRLEMNRLQLREERWVLLDITGKGRRRRTVAVPLWVRRLLDDWFVCSGVGASILLRTVRKGGQTTGPDQPLSEDAIYSLVKRYGPPLVIPSWLPTICDERARNCAAKRAAIWNKFSTFWAMPPSEPLSGISAPNRISSKPSMTGSKSG